MSAADIKAKEAAATARREKFMGTLHELQHRLNPKTIASDVKETVKEKASGAVDAAKDGAITAANHPSTVAAIAVPVLMYFFRKPIARGLSLVFRKDRADDEPLQPYEAARTPPAPAAPTGRAKVLTEQGV